MIIKHININSIESVQDSVICLGNFDGVHKGHQRIIKNCIKISKDFCVASSVLCFGSPLDYFLRKDFEGELTPLNTKIKLFEKYGIDICYVLEIDKDVLRLEPYDFIEKVLNKLRIRAVVVGDDYRFGKGGKGNCTLLKYFFDVNIIPYVLSENGLKISSTTIINILKNGDVDKAAYYLGRNYAIEGEVLHGLENGHKLGFPTANVDYEGFVLPKIGVYEVKVTVNDKKYCGLANVGFHPSIDQLSTPSLEVNIHNFNKTIYGETIKVEFVRFIREEMKFDNIDNLKNRLNLDTFFNF